MIGRVAAAAAAPAGLSAFSAWVGVEPPFCRRIPTRGSTPVTSSGALRPQPLTSATLRPSEDSGRTHNGPWSEARLRAKTLFAVELSDSGEMSTPPPTPARFATIDAKKSSMSPIARTPPPRTAAFLETVASPIARKRTDRRRRRLLPPRDSPRSSIARRPSFRGCKARRREGSLRCRRCTTGRSMRWRRSPPLRLLRCPLGRRRPWSDSRRVCRQWPENPSSSDPAPAEHREMAKRDVR